MKSRERDVAENAGEAERILRGIPAGGEEKK